MIDHSSNAIPLSVEPGAATDPTSERRARPLFAEDEMPTPKIAEPGRFDPGALATAEYRAHVASAEAAEAAATRQRLERRSWIAIGIHSTLLLVALVFFVAMFLQLRPEMLPGVLEAILGPPRPRPFEQIVYYVFDMIIVSGTVLLGLTVAERGLMRWARRGYSTDRQ